MKTRFIALLVFLVMIPFVVFSEDNTAIRITVEPAEPIDKSEQRPRTPSDIVPIEAYYQRGVIYLQFMEEIGCVDVSVINITTGEKWYDIACSDNLVETIAVSSVQGFYQINIETATGTVYSGEFSL